jgi:very-short-patch-repair endonuclease
MNKQRSSEETKPIAPLCKGGWGGSDNSVLRERGLIYGSFHLPYNPNLTERARELRKNPTPAEKKIWLGYLKNFQHAVFRQRPVDNYIVDFYCPEYRLVIEIDGESHLTDEGLEYDEERTRVLEGYGVRIVRFLNKDVLDNFEAVVDSIEETIQNLNRSPLTPLIKGGNKDSEESL